MLIEAINDYPGAAILVSHDRHLIEACADRLWLVGDGTVAPYEGDLDDYRRLVLGGEARASDTLAGMLTGAPINSQSALGIPANNYVFDNMNVRWEVIAPLMDRASPLRTTHLRDPFGVPHLFGMESFLDEIAVATNTDPIELRLRYLKKDREHDVIRAAAKQYGWDTRSSPRNDQQGNIAMGRGFAFRQMHDTFVATIAEVKVHRDTGVIEIERMVCAHDCGQIVNPVTIKHVIDRQMVWQTGRTVRSELVGLSSDGVRTPPELGFVASATHDERDRRA